MQITCVKPQNAFLWLIILHEHTISYFNFTQSTFKICVVRKLFIKDGWSSKQTVFLPTLYRKVSAEHSLDDRESGPEGEIS
jgi:hypothetical protein